MSVKCASVSIADEPTDLICSMYDDAAVLMVSQLGTVGTVVLAK